MDCGRCRLRVVSGTVPTLDNAGVDGELGWGGVGWGEGCWVCVGCRVVARGICVSGVG